MSDENKLTKETQIFIVEALACYRTPKQIIETVKELFEILLTKQQIYYYDQLCHKKLKGKATKAREELEKIFEVRRNDFLTKVENIPGFNQSYRVQVLNDLLAEEVEKQGRMRNPALIMELTEQLAKEAGGMFTNRRELSGPGGKAIPIENNNHDLSELTDDELLTLKSIHEKINVK